MKTLTLQEACSILSIDPATLRRWMKRARIETGSDEIDKRCKTLTYADVRQLARLHHKQLPGESQEDIQQQIDALEQRVEMLERQVAGIAKYPTPSHKAPPQSPRRQLEVSTLPPGYVSWRSFTRLHGIPDTTMQKAIGTGRIPVVKGEWKVGNVRVTGAFDLEGQARFYDLYHEHQNFAPCSECPHVTQESR